MTPLIKTSKAFYYVYLLSIFLIHIPLYGQTIIEKEIVSVDMRTYADQFGYSVAIDGDYAIIGAYHEDIIDSGGNNIDKAGAAYIYQKDNTGTWTLLKKLFIENPVARDFFGFSVSISGDYVLIGAYFRNANGITNSGAAYLYSKDMGGMNNWGLVKNLMAGDGALFDNFGNSVSISGDYALIGAYVGDGNIGNSGAAYLYAKDEGGTNNWGLVKKIIAQDGAAGDFFGGSVFISENYALIGANEDDDNNAINSGSVYIYSKDKGGTNNWGQVKKLTASDATAHDNFGISASLSGDNVLIGAYFDDDKGDRSGSAYLYSKDAGGMDNWGEVKKLTAGDGAANDRFGYSVSLSGDQALIGAYFDDDKGVNSGSVYVYSKDAGGMDNWGEVKKLTAGDGAADDRFGYSVSLSGDQALVGAYLDDYMGINSGLVYVYSKDAGGMDNWGEVKKLTAGDGAGSDYFGYSVSLSGDQALIGAYFDDDKGVNSGSAYVYSKDAGGMDNWGEVKKLTARDGAVTDYFGRSVSINGTDILIGAPQLETYLTKGKAYFFSEDKAPKVTNVNSSNEDNTYKAGDIINIIITFNEVVTVTGTPQLTLETGINDAIVNYTSGSGTNALVFTYTVAAGHNSPDLAYLNTNALAVNEQSSIIDANNNIADLTLPPPGTASSLSGNKNIVISQGLFIEEQLCIDMRDYADQYGVSVAIDGNYAVIGASQENISISEGNTLEKAGAAYIYQRNNIGKWTLLKKIIASDVAAEDRFGQSVSISGDYILIGAYGDESLTGAAYVYHKDMGGTDNWGEVKKLTASDGSGGDSFGFSVSISGDYALVGAFGNNGLIGATYVYHKDIGGADNWGQVKKLVHTGAATNDFFGVSVSLSGAYALIGATGDSEKGSFAGAAYLFGKDMGGTDNWGQIRQLTASDAAAGDQFGSNIYIAGGDVLIGASGKDDNGNKTGAAYVFNKNWGGQDNWGEVKKLSASDGTTNNRFGSSVAISGDDILIGALGNTEKGSFAGAAYLFRKNWGGQDNWGEVKKLITGDAAAEDRFGTSVGIDGTNMLIGAPQSSRGSIKGKAYFFSENLLPTITNISSTNKDSTYKNGAIIHIEITFSEIVNVTGSPQLILETGIKDAIAHYTSGSGTNTLVFTYTVSEEDNSPDLAYQNTTALKVNDQSSIMDANNNIADLTLPLPGTTNSLSGNKDLVISQGAIEQTKQVCIDMRDYADQFGHSVAIDGNYAVIGAYQEHLLDAEGNNINKPGAAYIYQKDNTGTWTMLKRLVAENPVALDRFGYSVSISGDYVLVGAFFDDDKGTNSGAAYLYSKDEGGTNNWGLVKKLTAFDGAERDQFGYSVSLSGDYALIGAHFNDEHGTNSGAAYLYFKDTGGTNNWGQVKKLTAGDGAKNDYFGHSVSLSGDYALIGAYFDDDNAVSSGSAYLYFKDEGGMNNWGQVKKLTAFDGAKNDVFGYSVSIDGTNALIGACRDDAAANGRNGSAYLYSKDTGGVNNWGLVKKLIAEDGAANDFFGFSVSLSGDYLLIGANSDDDKGDNSGTAYLYSKDSGGINNWGLVKKLTAGDGVTKDFFGTSVSIDGTTLLIGAPQDLNKTTNKGKAYFFSEGIAPIITNVSSNNEDKTYKKGDAINISVAFSKNVQVIGTPQLGLETGSNDATVHYTSGSGTDTLVFTYTVAAGHISPDLAYLNTLALTVDLQSSIMDANNNIANLTLPTPGTANSLSGNKALIIDGVAPTVTSMTPADDAININVNTNLNLTFSENIQVGTGNILIQRMVEGNMQTVQTIDIQSDLVEITGNQVLINPSEDLMIATDYYINIDATAITDLAGNTYAGINDPTTWNFKTGEPEIALSVNGNNIMNGATVEAANTSNGTDFGSACLSAKNSITYTISNLGSMDLVLTTNPVVQITGSTQDFTVAVQATSPIAASNTSTFEIEFTPTEVGLRTATVSISNNDVDENPFTFMIKGTGQASVGGSISGGKIVCTGTNSTELTLNNYNGIIQKWQKADNENFSNAEDITNSMATYTATDLTKTTYYRAEVKNSECASAYSSTATITVNELSVGGAIEGGDLYCSGANLFNLNLNNHLGTILNWEYDTDQMFNNPQVLNEQTSTIELENITETTYYRAKVKNGSCPEVYSTVATVMIDTVDMDGDNRPDCQQECLEIRNVIGVFGSPIVSGTYKAVRTVMSDGEVPNGHMVRFKAGESITLTSGFTVAAGGDFHAEIGPCTLESIAQEEQVPEEVARVLKTEEQEMDAQPISLKLQPNPFKETASVAFYLPVNQEVSLHLFDQSGILIRTIIKHQMRSSGMHLVQIREEQDTRGLYYLVLQSEIDRIVKKVVMLR